MWFKQSSFMGRNLSEWLIYRDCCDGSDEYSGKIKCKNTCWEAGKVARQRLKKKLATFQEGLTIRKHDVEQAKISVAKDEVELSRLKEEENLLKFYGSTPVGKKLMAGADDTVKKVSLELGGNAPCIIFDDADLEVALNSSVTEFDKKLYLECHIFIRLHNGVGNQIL